MKSLLITGTAGFIGARTAQLALDAGHEGVGPTISTMTTTRGSSATGTLPSVFNSETRIPQQLIQLPTGLPGCPVHTSFLHMRSQSL